MKKTLLLLLLFPNALFAFQELGVYAPMWQMNPAYGDQFYSPATMNWTKISWVVAFAANIDITSQPYLNLLSGHRVNGVPTNPTDSAAFEYNYTTTNWLGLLVTNSHANGAKTLLGIDMVDPTSLKTLISRGQDSVDLFVKRTVEYCNRKGIDGVDLNIETWITSPPTPAEISMLFRRFRYWMTFYAQSCSLLTIAPGQGNSNIYQKDSVNFYVDKVHIQFYAYDPVWFGPPVLSNSSWFINPLRRGTGLPAAFEGSGIETDLLNWVSAGYTKSKLEIGISTYVWLHTGIDTVMKPISSYGYGTYQFAQSSLSKGGVSHWDNIRKATWIGGTATASFGSGQTAVSLGQKFYITTPSDSNTYHIARYVIDNGYGGFWFYDLSMDHSESSNPKNPIINYAQTLLSSSGISVRRAGESIPKGFALDQNYPNPFNPSTIISFSIPVRTHVKLKVFNSLGQVIAVLAEGEQDAGKYQVTFDTASISSGKSFISTGIYFYRLETSEFSETKKLLFIK